MEFLLWLECLGINIEQVLNRFCNNEALLRRFICKFPQEKTYQSFKDAFLSADLKLAEQHAHTLKGIAANLGFEALCEKCSVMVAELRGARSCLDNKFEAINKEYARITDRISEFMANC